MNLNHLKLLTQHFNLGTYVRDPKRVYGGLLHLMWRINTNIGSYAVKQLSTDVDLADGNVIKNYELSERIASGFALHDIPAIPAIAKSGKFLFIIEGTGYLVYPWVDAKASDRDEVSIDKALEITRLLAKMHLINLEFKGIDEPEFDIHDNADITELMKASNTHSLLFAENLTINLATLLEINKNYLNSIESLKKQTVISHGDLDQKNVLWDRNNQPLLIDWESARKLNPTYEIVNAALDWSGITTNFNVDIFRKMLRTYQQAGGLIEHDLIEAAFYGVIGNWINWMIYNIKRALTSENLEQKKMGIEQVNQVLPTILRVKNLMPELIKECSL